MQPEDKLRRFLQSDELLSDKVRFAIMVYLSIRGRTRFKTLEENLDLTPGNLASHLERLEKAGYVETRRWIMDARSRVVTSTPIGLAALAESFSRLKDLLVENPNSNASSEAERTSPSGAQ